MRILDHTRSTARDAAKFDREVPSFGRLKRWDYGIYLVPLECRVTLQPFNLKTWRLLSLTHSYEDAKEAFSKLCSAGDLSPDSIICHKFKPGCESECIYTRINLASKQSFDEQSREPMVQSSTQIKPFSQVEIRLSWTEQKILELSAQGLSEGEISNKLSIESEALKKHISEIRRKLIETLISRQAKSGALVLKESFLEKFIRDQLEGTVKPVRKKLEPEPAQSEATQANQSLDFRSVYMQLLTKREIELLTIRSGGFSYQYIADYYGTSLTSINQQMAVLLSKFFSASKLLVRLPTRKT